MISLTLLRKWGGMPPKNGTHIISLQLLNVLPNPFICAAPFKADALSISHIFLTFYLFAICWLPPNFYGLKYIYLYTCFAILIIFIW